MKLIPEINSISNIATKKTSLFIAVMGDQTFSEHDIYFMKEIIKIKYIPCIVSFGNNKTRIFSVEELSSKNYKKFFIIFCEMNNVRE